jgi:hypothetical protein
VTSTPVGTQVPVPADIVGSPNLSIYSLADGNYIVIDLGANPISVNGKLDTDYDLVYYENINLINCLGICIDQVIIGISNSPTGGPYYEVFNWGDGVADMNSNVGDVAGLEEDNQPINIGELYGTIPYQTGIAIDVDNATSNPPLGPYQYVVILSPEGGSGEAAEINAIEVIPDPPVAPASVMSIQSADEAPVASAKEAQNPPEDNTSPPVDNAPSSPAEAVPAPPAEEVPATP